MSTSRLRGLRSWATIVVCAVVASLPAQAQIEDTTPPVIVDVNVAPTEIDTTASSQTVQVFRTVTDDLSGVGYFGNECSPNFTSGWVFTSPSGSQTAMVASCAFSLNSGTELDGEFVSTITFPQFAEPGVWQLTRTIVSDQAGNTLDLSSTALSALGLSASVNIISVSDTTSPVITAVSASPNEIDTTLSSQTVQVSRTVTDDLSGVGYFGNDCSPNFLSGWVFRSPSGAQTVSIPSCAFSLNSGTELNGVFVSTVAFPRFAEPGVWTLSRTIVSDQAGNTTDLNASQLAALGLSATVNVTSISDTTPPVITGVSASPQYIDTSLTSQTVQVTRTVTDDLSGVAYWSTDCSPNFVSGWVFTSPSGGQFARVASCIFFRAAGTDLDGEWYSTITFPRYAESGIWHLTRTIVTDQAGNTTDLVKSELDALGLSAWVQVNSFPTVYFDAGGYDGTWALIDNDDGATVFSGTGDQELTLEPGFYLLDIGQNLDYIEVQADSNVISGNPVAFSGGLAQVTFHTGPVVVDPMDYEGTWSMVSVADYDTAMQPGAQAHTLVLGTNYLFRPAGHSPADVAFAVDALGDVDSYNPVAASGIGNVLRINTAAIVVDPGLYDGLWAIRGVRQFDTADEPGPQIVRLIRSLRFVVRIGNQSTADFVIELDAAGNVSSWNAKAASTLGDLLNFRTHKIDIDPGNYTGGWRFVRWDPVSGQNSFELLPGLTYRIWTLAGPEGYFFVDDPCAVDPPQLPLDGGTFDISCGLRDADGDGVPDISDNCMLEANPDQVDQDLDSVGNACDDDLDGDGIDNALDNCPDFENVGQEDLDGDGIGDVCDDDTDQDSVANLSDNCPNVPNTDQGDNDLDQVGDACDADDDNDGVPDVADNCPLDANPDQADFNLNGQGDVCDGDVDGDGVTNDEDLCELSPQSSLVNEFGCSGPQFIALLCHAEDFDQHGQYVNCVAHAANEAVEQGLISPEEKARFIREAAKVR